MMGLTSLLLAINAIGLHAFALVPPINDAAGRVTTTTTTTTTLGAKKRGFGGGSSATASGGFGSATKTKKKKGPAFKNTFQLEEDGHIQDYLNPRLFEDPDMIPNIKEKIRNGEVVVIRDAFRADFAEAMHAELDNLDGWSKNEDYFEDGYHFKHSNIYDRKDYTDFLEKTIQIFDSDPTKEFVTDLTGRDCTGEAVGAPSLYEGGDHSLPHTDHIGQRTVAYVWHLSKNWRPEWGGGLYWADEPLAQNAYLHASFNTLVLFSVTPRSSHFVTTVSPLAKERRLAFNGWWLSSWIPTAQDKLEDLLATPEQRQTLTHTQVLAINDMLDDPWAPQIQPPERRADIEGIRSQIMDEMYPSASAMSIV